MSAKPETVFTASVHRHLPKSLYHMKNNNPYNSGIADVWYSGKKSDLWVEYKFVVLPKRDDTVITLTGGKSPLLSHLQQAWLKDRCGEGRSVAVILGCKEGGVFFSSTTWDVQFPTGMFRAGLMSRQSLASIIKSITGGP